MAMNRKKRSALWQFFSPIDHLKASCDVCKKVVSYKSSVTNLRSHLSRKHQTVILVPPAWKLQDSKESKSSPTKKGPPALKLEQVGLQHVVQWTDEPQESSHPAVLSQLSSIEFPETQVKGQNRKMSSCPTEKSSNPKNNKTDRALLKLFIDDFHPFSIVDNEGFKAFVQELNPNYRLPSQKTISKTLVPALYEKCYKNAKEIAKSIKKVCLTIDFWTSVNNDRFISVLGHFIDEIFNLKSILLECSLVGENYTSTELEELLKRIVKVWELEDKIVLVVSSNDEVIVNVLKQKMKVKHFGCFADTLNLAVGNALNILSISDVLNKVRSIAAYFKGNEEANAQLFALQQTDDASSPKKLIMDVETQWHSTYHMLERFIELENAIRTMDVTNMDVLQFEEQELLLVKELVKVLQPFEAVTKLISGENYKISSYVVVVTNGLLEGCKEIQNMDVSDEVKLFAQNVSEELSVRLGNVECSEILGVATYLDPRFKNIAFQDHEAELWMKEKILMSLNKIIGSTTDKETGVEIQDTENDPLFKFFDRSARLHKPTSLQHKQGVIELQRYIEEDLLPRDKNPLEWWKDNMYNYPYLSQIAQEYLCTLGTSISAERLFSKAGLLIHERMTRLSSKAVQQLLSLHVNSKLLNE